jgi:hypothetical protein
MTTSTSKTIWAVLQDCQKQVCETGIAKDQKGHQYKFRGIDQIYNTMAPIFANAGLTVLPTVTDWSIERLNGANGKAMFHSKVSVTYKLVSHSGDATEVTAVGEAFDNADKGTGKAMSMAYKYAMFQLFCIPLDAQDTDSVQYAADEEVIAPEFSQEVLNQRKDMLGKVLDKVRAGKNCDEAITWFDSKWAQIPLTDAEKHEFLAAASEAPESEVAA